MNTIVKITVNPNDLIAKIIINYPNEKIINKLKIICSNLSENFNPNNYSIPWFELRRGIISIAQILKNDAAILEFDDFANELVQEIIDDKKCIKEKTTSFKIDPEKFKEILNKEGFNRALKDEQLRDALKLINIKHGANFSVPGAGKTATILALHIILKYFGVVSKLFVVSPINAFISWEDEIIEIFKNKKFKIIRLNNSHLQDFTILSNENPDIVLVNYEKLRKDVSQLVPFFINNKVHLILDESHRVKSGVNNISYNQIIKLADLAKRRDILSGTPMPQKYLDLEPQFDFLWPGENIIPKPINGEDPDGIVANINQAINTLYVRTTKNELGLIDPIINYINIPMGQIQAELYKLFKSESARIIAGLDKITKNNFRRIGRSVIKLLQAATNPMLLTGKDEYDEENNPLPLNREFWELLEDFTKYEKPAKIEFLKKKVKATIDINSNNKVLIWSYFVKNILILEKILKEYNPVIIYGGIPTGSDDDEVTREWRIREFHQNPECKVMIANPQACGEGISLHKVCHHAIYLDRNFNAAYFLQSIDRIHRLGLEPGIATNIDILIAENTIDEILINRLNDKIINMGHVLNDPYLHSLAYDPADISADDELGIDMNDFYAIKEHVIKD